MAFHGQRIKSKILTLGLKSQMKWPYLVLLFALITILYVHWSSCSYLMTHTALPTSFHKCYLLFFLLGLKIISSEMPSPTPYLHSKSNHPVSQQFSKCGLWNPQNSFKESTKFKKKNKTIFIIIQRRYVPFSLR